MPATTTTPSAQSRPAPTPPRTNPQQQQQQGRQQQRQQEEEDPSSMQLMVLEPLLPPVEVLLGPLIPSADESKLMERVSHLRLVLEQQLTAGQAAQQQVGPGQLAFHVACASSLESGGSHQAPGCLLWQSRSRQHQS